MTWNILNFRREKAQNILCAFQGIYMCILGAEIRNGKTLRDAHKVAMVGVEYANEKKEWWNACAQGEYAGSGGKREEEARIEYLTLFSLPLREDEEFIAYTSHSRKLYIIHQIGEDTFQIMYPPNSSVASAMEKEAQ